MIALILTGLASIPLCVRRKPKNLLAWTVKTRLRVQLHSILVQLGEGFLQIGHVVDLFIALDQYINICFDVSPKLVFKYLLNETLVYSSRILQTEGHYLVAVSALARDE